MLVSDHELNVADDESSEDCIKAATESNLVSRKMRTSVVSFSF